MRFFSHLDITKTSELLLPITLGASVISLLAFAGFLAYTFYSLWRRLSPPLASIKKDLGRIAGGELSGEIVLRENDEFQDLAADLDGMRRQLREKILLIKESQQALSASAAELCGSIDKGKPSTAHAASLQSAVERMKEQVNAFHYPA